MDPLPEPVGGVTSRVSFKRSGRERDGEGEREREGEGEGEGGIGPPSIASHNFALSPWKICYIQWVKVSWSK